MPPFDRRSKAPTVARPPSGFDAPANNNTVARMPWEREDDDEFGPPPALDLSPGDAEAEAKRMVYETTHPLNPALMQNAHFDHNRAMRRYAALARRAWDPAARDTPVQPVSASSEATVTKPAASRALGKAGESPLEPGAEQPARPPVREHFDTQPFQQMAAERQRQQSADTLSRMPVGKRTEASENLTIIPHQRTDAEWAEIGRLVLEHKWLSETDQYVHRYILGFESLAADTQGKSRGGIQQELLNKDKELLMLLNAFRHEEGKPAIALGASLQTFSSSDLLDVQRVYLANALDPFNSKDESIDTWLNETVQNGSFLAGWGPPELAAQIADAVFQHGTKAGSQLIQWAVNSLLPSISADDRAHLKLPTHIKADGIIGSISQTVIKTLANDSRWTDLFLRAIRDRRTAYTRQADSVGHGQAFEGATMNRIWGIWMP